MTTTPDATPDTAAAPDQAFSPIPRDYIVPSTNINGWTGARQKRFLEAIADGDTVVDACEAVSLSPQSAYAFRRRAKGRAFDLGWKAADLLARERVAADLMVRATDGQQVTITRDDGTATTMHHYDNRLALQMLNRLDRYADASENTAPGHAARMVAGDFDAYLDVIGAEGGPARAGLFMLARTVGVEGADGARPAAELEPIIALARADRTLRCGTLATDIDAADLDPAQRAGWTAGQWARAEACGLLVLAPQPEPEPEPEPQPAKAAATYQPMSTSLNKPVWFCETNDQWRTHFPPPEDFDGDEDGEWFDGDYERELTEAECALLGLIIPGSDEDLAEAQAERDAWFAAYVAANAGSEEDDASSSPLPLAGEAGGEPEAAASEPLAETTSLDPIGQRNGNEEHSPTPPVDPCPTPAENDSHGLQEA